MSCNCIANCPRCSEYVESLEKEIEQLHIGITQLRDHYAVEGEEAHDILSNLLKRGNK